jgi:hypothetical protein
MMRSFSGNSGLWKNIIRIGISLLVFCALVFSGIIIAGNPVQAVCQVAITYPAANQLFELQECQNFNLTFVFLNEPSPGNHYDSNFLQALPAGLNYDPVSRSITGIPAAGTSTANPVTYTLYLREQNSAHATLCFTSVNFKLHINACALSFVATLIPVGKVGVPYTVTLAAQGGAAPYTWTVNGLPPGLLLSPNGTIAGTPLPGSAGVYTVWVTVNDSCCGVAHQGSFSLIIEEESYYFTVSIGDGLKDGITKVYIDDELMAELKGGQTKKYETTKGETHVVRVESPVQNPNDPETRYVVKGSNEKVVSVSETSAHFEYVEAVYIDFESNPGGITQPPGAGWYGLEEEVTSSVPEVVESDKKGEQYRFYQWTDVDGRKVQTPDLLFKAGKPGTATAHYKKYCLLTIKSDDPPLNVENWYEDGTTASYDIGVTSMSMNGFLGMIGGTRHPVNGMGSIDINGPTTLNVTWENNPTVPIIIICVCVLLIAAGAFFAIRRFAPAAKGAGSGQAATLPAKPAAAESRYCSGCGEKLKQGSNICDRCGKKVAGDAERKNKCPKCGDEIVEGERYCDKCGNKLVS